jgi:hypothetical protein
MSSPRGCVCAFPVTPDLRFVCLMCLYRRYAIAEGLANPVAAFR